MSERTVLKAEKDYSKEVDALLPEAQQLAKTNVHDAIEKLAVLEKQCRQASDLASSSRILIGIVTMAKDAGDWKLVNEQVISLSKKHGQLKQAITRMIQTAMNFINQTPDMQTKMSLIETLRTVTEGKIFVEVERARVTRMLSDIKKGQGDINGAAAVLCELQVETFGTMARREKTEFILEQVDLCIAKEDWTQATVLSRKISTRYFARKPKKSPEELEKAIQEAKEREEKRTEDDAPVERPDDDVTDLKLRYYHQQIIIASHENKYLEVCKHYRQILDTEAIEASPDKLQATLQRIIYYNVLSPYDNEQYDLLNRIAADTRINQVPVEARLLKKFTVHELMRWPVFAEEFGPHLCTTDVFSAKPSLPVDDKPFERWQDLRKRVIEHNVRVVAKYYTRIQTSRLCELLDLSEEETEKYISDLVTSKTIYARIDRPAGVVNFAKSRDADDILNEWSGNVKSLLGLLERVDHLITKEEMMARILPTKSGKTSA
ncbi:proteasome regulatory particle subunit [Ascosphaera apis ARSEF 7405]|uniref:Proteasome regulatory particle subunit n=1 Tax=Ascosphaera apis ARSEF 7405 TaxID=392613 RepID=A0A166PI10_9EURO|nr:proteasome regulatory particle subunit [Ascosphaera apis ARSEF 7405]